METRCSGRCQGIMYAHHSGTGWLLSLTARNEPHLFNLQAAQQLLRSSRGCRWCSCRFFCHCWRCCWQWLLRRQRWRRAGHSSLALPPRLPPLLARLLVSPGPALLGLPLRLGLLLLRCRTFSCLPAGRRLIRLETSSRLALLLGCLLLRGSLLGCHWLLRCRRYCWGRICCLRCRRTPPAAVRGHFGIKMAEGWRTVSISSICARECSMWTSLIQQAGGRNRPARRTHALNCRPLQHLPQPTHLLPAPWPCRHTFAGPPSPLPAPPPARPAPVRGKAWIGYAITLGGWQCCGPCTNWVAVLRSMHHLCATKCIPVPFPLPACLDGFGVQQQHAQTHCHVAQPHFGAGAQLRARREHGAA